MDKKRPHFEISQRDDTLETLNISYLLWTVVMPTAWGMGSGASWPVSYMTMMKHVSDRKRNFISCGKMPTFDPEWKNVELMVRSSVALADALFPLRPLVYKFLANNLGGDTNFLTWILESVARTDSINFMRLLMHYHPTLVLNEETRVRFLLNSCRGGSLNTLGVYRTILCTRTEDVIESGALYILCKNDTNLNIAKVLYGLCAQHDKSFETIRDSWGIKPSTRTYDSSRNTFTRYVNCVLDSGLSIVTAAFHAACYSGSTNMAKWILDIFGGDEDSQVRVTIGTANKYGPLRAACVHGHLELAKWLFGQFGKGPAVDSSEIFAKACMNGHLDVVKWLYIIHCFVPVSDSYTIENVCRCRDVACVKYYMDICKEYTKIDINYDKLALNAAEQDNGEVFMLLMNRRPIGSDMMERVFYEQVMDKCRELKHPTLEKWVFENKGEMHMTNAIFDSLSYQPKGKAQERIAELMLKYFPTDKDLLERLRIKCATVGNWDVYHYVVKALNDKK
jgi:hypothetical protein